MSQGGSGRLVDLQKLTVSYTNELKAKLAPLSAEMAGLVNKAKAESNRGFTSEEREKFHALEADYTAIEDSIRFAERSTSIVDHLANTPGAKIQESHVEELQDTFRTSKPKNKDNSARGQAFRNYLRNAEQTTREDRKTLGILNAQTITTTGGGYLIPTGFSDLLEEATLWFGGIEGTVGKLVTSTGQPINYPTVNDTTNKGRFLGVNTQVTETDFTFGQVVFNAYTATSDVVLIPLQLVEDSYFDIEALAARLLGTRLGRLKNNACTVGTGSSQPTGIVTAANTAGNTVTFGTGETASINFNNLIDLEGAVDPSFRNKSTWMFSDAMLKLLKKLVDGNNRPLWQPAIMSSFMSGASVTEGKPMPMILDHPYIINNDMAAPATSAKSILFGDLSKFVVRETVEGSTLIAMKERYADYLQVGYVAFQRYDSQLVDAGTHPIALGIQSAS